MIAFIKKNKYQDVKLNLGIIILNIISCSELYYFHIQNDKYEETTSRILDNFPIKSVLTSFCGQMTTSQPPETIDEQSFDSTYNGLYLPIDGPQGNLLLPTKPK